MKGVVGHCAIVIALSACIPGAVAPGISLGTCEATLATRGLSFVDFLAASVVNCGSDMLAVIDAILASSDPAVAKYKDEAAAAKSDRAKMSALKASVEGRAAAMRAGK